VDKSRYATATKAASDLEKFTVSPKRYLIRNETKGFNSLESAARSLLGCSEFSAARNFKQLGVFKR